MSKYHAKATTVDGIRFHSQKEARRYGELRLLEKAGKIHRLKLQPKYALLALSGHKVGEYRGDFEYCVCANPSGGCGMFFRVTEDVKGYDTPLSKWKRKHLKAQEGIEVSIV